VVDRKTRILRSDLAELTRQIDQLDWASSYIQYASQLFAPVDFLQMWKFYGQYRRALTHQAVQGGVSVVNDIFVEGELRITSPSMHFDERVLSPRNSAAFSPPPQPLIVGGIVAGWRESEGEKGSPQVMRTAVGSPRVFASKLREFEEKSASSFVSRSCLPDWSGKAARKTHDQFNNKY
jgi:hypothetical protein